MCERPTGPAALAALAEAGVALEVVASYQLGDAGGFGRAVDGHGQPIDQVSPSPRDQGPADRTDQDRTDQDRTDQGWADQDQAPPDIAADRAR